jgi:hypothetical protein
VRKEIAIKVIKGQSEVGGNESKINYSVQRLSEMYFCENLQV